MALIAALLIFLSPAPATSAARGVDPAPPVDEFDWQLTAALTLRVQKALKEAGLYSGPLDGRMGPGTAAAIRTYQRSAKVPVDGRITLDLADKIDMWVRVDQLRKRLEKVSRERKTAARNALLSTPETRDLLANKPPEAANALHDPTPCLNAPTVSCLLDEARESAKAIHKDDMRDWALGELLTTQAEVGYADRALEVTKRLSDPRLILIALRDIAEAHAKAGRSAAALRAAEIIPDPARQREAFSAIADILARQGNLGATDAIARLGKSLNDLEDGEEKVTGLAGMAIALSHSKKTGAATPRIRQAEAMARAMGGNALRSVAEALAKMDRPFDAISIINDLDLESDRIAGLMTVVKSYVRMNRSQDALKTAEKIIKPQYRAVALSLAARSLAKAGVQGQVADVLIPALQAAEETTSPYARSYAFSRVALAQAWVDFDTAQTTSSKIENTQLKAATLWAITLQQKAAGHDETASRAQKLADTATRDINNRLTRFWLWSDLALDYHKAGNTQQAQEVFFQARDAARGIKDPWQSCRALSRLASVLNSISSEE